MKKPVSLPSSLSDEVPILFPQTGEEKEDSEEFLEELEEDRESSESSEEADYDTETLPGL